MEKSGFTIIDYEPRYKQELLEISIPWLEEYNILEPVDIEMLEHPEDILNGGGRIFLAKVGDDIAGMLMLELQENGYCEALKYGVKEPYRNRGIGRALMQRVIDEARALGRDVLMVTSEHQLKAALHIYESVGFQYVEYKDPHFQLSDIRMEMPLK